MPKNSDPFVHIPEQSANIFKPVAVAIMFFDVIGFTRETTNESMRDCIRGIENTIYDVLWEDYNWNETNKSNELILIPTGDGYALVFNPKISLDKVLEVIKKFCCRLSENLQKFKFRVGVAKGWCLVHKDSNDKNNVFGYGINLANRVMGLALENQILIHEVLAEEILTQREHNELHKVGSEFHIKHGEVLKVYNFYGEYQGDIFGNKDEPVDPITQKPGGDQ